jgi:hypothetical protein
LNGYGANGAGTLWQTEQGRNVVKYLVIPR